MPGLASRHGDSTWRAGGTYQKIPEIGIPSPEIQHFFRVRLWDPEELIDQLLEQYANLDENLRSEFPLKRIWTVASQEEET